MQLQKILFCSGFVVAMGSAQAIDRLTVEAIENGKAFGTAPADMASKIMAKTKSKNPIYMNVAVLKRYEQFGCARLDYRVRQENVMGTDGKFYPVQMEWQMNICLDGQPPAQPMKEART